MDSIARLPMGACELAPRAHADVRVRVTFGTNGHVKAVDAEPAWNDAIEHSLRTCVVDAVRGVTIAPRAEEVTVTQIIALVGTEDGRAARAFDRGWAAAALSRVRYNDCGERAGWTGSGHIQITYASSGQVESAVIDTLPLAGTDVARCIEDRFRGTHVPPFDGSPVKVGKAIEIP